MNSKNSLYEKLKSYSSSDVCPMHMPGHKRNTSLLGEAFPYDIDITEINGFDNLHHAEGIIKNAMEKARELFNSDSSFLLINGSTCGILAAVRCAARYGDEIIIARNSHKAVYNACELNGLTVHYIYPPIDPQTGINGSITSESVTKALDRHPNASAVVVTSPTYEGVISDIGTISEIVHSRNIPLIVDNAHGAHQKFCSFCEGEPVECGADIVISSLHKTLPSLTQTAVAHINGALINSSDFAKQLSVFETSSPSYILMASMDRCFDVLAEKGEVLFKEYEKNLSKFSEKVKSLKNLTVVCHGNDSLENHDYFAFDYGKIVICTNNCSINGVELSQILRDEYNTELEMAYSFYAVAMTSICDSRENFDRLANALTEIDRTAVNRTYAIAKQPPMPIPRQSKYTFASLPVRKAPVRLSDAVGKISLDYVFAYPPGIPLIVPGEVIDNNLIEYAGSLKDCGVEVQSTCGASGEIIINVAEEK